MELRYLSRLIEGKKVPFDPKFRSLSTERKQNVEDFVRDLATRYSSEELKQEVAMLAEKKKTFLYFIVNGWEDCSLGFTVIISAIYWVQFGFWACVLCFIALCGIFAKLEKRVAALLLSESSIELLDRYNAYVDRQVKLQNEENKSNV